MNDELLDATEDLVKAIRGNADERVREAALNDADAAVRRGRAVQELAQLEAQEAKLTERIEATRARRTELEAAAGKRRRGRR